MAFLLLVATLWSLACLCAGVAGMPIISPSLRIIHTVGHVVYVMENLSCLQVEPFSDGHGHKPLSVRKCPGTGLHKTFLFHLP